MNHWLFRRVSALIAIVLVTSGFMTPIVMANQDLVETSPFYSAAYECPYDAGQISYVQGTVPGDCAPIAGFFMNVAVEGWGAESCVTGADGACSVMVPFDSWLVVTEDNSSRPDLLPLTNPISRHTSELDAVFVHVVIQEVVPEPIVIDEPVVEQPVIEDPIDGDEGESTDPVDVDEGDVTQPVDGEESDVTQPVDGEENDATDPVDVDEGDVTDPVNGEEGDVTQPVDGEESDATDPDDGEQGDVTDPVDGEEGDATDPVDSEQGDVTDPVDGEEGDATDPVDGEEGDATDFVDGEEGDGSETDGVRNVDLSTPGSVETVNTNLDGDDFRVNDSLEADPSYVYALGVGDQGLICYSQPDFASEHLHVFKEAERLEVVAIDESGFIQVICGEVNGYVDASLVSGDVPAEIPGEKAAATPDVVMSATPAPVAGSSTMLANTASTPLKPRGAVERVMNAPGGVLVCYSAMTGSSTQLRTFANGNSFYRNGPIVNGWLAVECGGQNGYVMALFTSAVVKIAKPATSVEMLTSSNNQACRSTPHPQGTIIMMMTSGTRFYATGPALNGWLPVNCIGRAGYIPAGLTSAVVRPAGATTSVEMLFGNSRLACRTAPHLQASIITTLPGGTHFYATGPVSGGWLPINCKGFAGFIPAGGTTAITRPAAAMRSVEMLRGSGGLACRTAPHPQAKVIYTLPRGTQFYATGSVSNGWLPINCKGRAGYIPAGGTTAVARSAGAMRSVEMLTGSGGLACRTAPHPQASVISVISSGTKFYATGSVSNGWLPINCKGRAGYIPAGGTTAVARSAGAMTSVERLTVSGRLACRTAPHPQAGVISMLPEGTQFYATGPITGGWLPINCKGRAGYVPASKTTAVPRTPAATISVQMLINVESGGLVCRTTPHPSGGVISTFSNHHLISVTGSASNGWLPVECNGRAGYLRVANTTLASKPLKPSLGTTTIFNTGRSGTVCRSAPSMQATALQTLREGASVRVTGSAVHKWIPVQCGGKNGYIYITNTTTRVPHQSAGTRAAMVQGVGSDGLVCRTSVSGGSQIMVFAERSPVDVISWSNGWAKVRCAERDGYVQMRYLTFNASDPWTTVESLWIDVNLSSQYMIVYQGERIIGQTYISSGRYPTFETPTGTFFIINKIPISAMAGCSGGECWYVPDVPDQMYFTNRGHAFHGTYWHDDYGTRRSHGCINLPMGIASWLYDITPYGTRVVIHY